MHSTIVKKISLFLSIFIVVTLACDLAVTVASPTEPAIMPTNTVALALDNPTQIPVSATSIPTTEAPVPATVAPTSQPTSIDGVWVTYGPLGFILPSGIASGFVGDQFSHVEGDSVAPWEVTPGHTQITLDGQAGRARLSKPPQE